VKNQPSRAFTKVRSPGRWEVPPKFKKKISFVYQKNEEG